MYKQVATKTIDDTDSPYTLEVQYKNIIVDSSAGDVIITLPSVSTLGIIFKTKIVHNSAGTLTINADVADTINDIQSSVVSITDGEVLSLETVADTLLSIVSNLPSSTALQVRVTFDSDSDLTSSPIFMRGDLFSLNMYAESKLTPNSTNIDVRLDSTDTWTGITQGAAFEDTVANLLTWVNANVSVGVLWEFRLIVVYDGGETAESSILVEYITA